MQTITIELTYGEAETWRILKEAGVFNIVGGSAELHFNAQGQIAKIDTHIPTFRRVRVVVPGVESSYATSKKTIRTE